MTLIEALAAVLLILASVMVFKEILAADSTGESRPSAKPRRREKSPSLRRAA